MIVTPALKEELANWLDTYWATYLKGDIATWATFIRDDYRNIGGTKEEIWNSKQEIINYTNSILDQMLGTVDIRNRKVELIPYGEYMMVHEFTDLFVKIEEEWTFYGPFRMSSLLEKTDTGWIALHQHGSYPDMKAMEGEAFSIDALKAENAKLQAAVKSRTMELQQNNRELEIEAATERVRVQSMAMQHPDDLDKVNKEILNQLNQLQIPGLTGVTFYLVNENGWVNAWDFSSPGNIGAPNSYTLQFDFTKYEMIGEPFRVLLQSDQDYFVADYPLEKLEKAVYELEEINTRIASVVKEALANGKLTHQWSVCARISNGLLAIDLINPPSEDTKTIVLKMAGAFNQAYQRFLDLQKAEAQARESQIETGLERVRSRSLAMHHTSELQEVINTVHKELLNLNIAIHGGSFITINSDIDKTLRCWGSGGTANTSEEIHLPLYEKPFCTNLINRIKSGPGFFTEKYSQQEKTEFFTFLFRHEPWSRLDDVQKQETLQSQGGYTRSCCVSKHTSIFIINHLGETFAAADNEILKRFATVFEQTYTRFQDLQKAEGQARAAQIELAVERVRAKALAMHHSPQILEVVTTLRDEMLSLEIPGIVAATIYLQEEEEGYIRMWDLSSVTKKHDSFHVALDVKFKPEETDPGLFIRRVWNNKENYFVEKQEAHDMEITIEWLRQYYPAQADEATQFFAATPWKYLLHPTIRLEHGKMSVDIMDSQPPADMETIMVKMGAAFDLAYKRFLDLQKAEAQAREAKIEAALERTRTQSMIMQHSNELDDTLRVFHEQVLRLGIPSAFSFLWLPDESNDRHIFWAAWGEKINGSTLFKSKAINYPLDRKEPATAQCLVDWKSNEPVYSYHVPPAAVENYFAVWQELLQGVHHLEPVYFQSGLYYVEAFMKYGCFGVMVVNDLTEDEKKLLSRFANEFERTYTRFLDLQKAEAQTREAQIEAALERVRAKTMAMQKSTDLAQTSALLFEQLNTLVPELWTSGFVLCDRTKAVDEWWLSGGSGFMPDLILPNVGDPLHNNIYKAWLNGATYYEEVIEGKPLQQHYEWLMTIPSAKAAFDAQALAGIKQPVWQQLSCAYFARGYLVVITETPCSEASIFQRFAQVFDQTYTRFLDLQKAEAQAREAQIEAALERVRSRTMAMQRSDELLDVASILFQQVKALGVPQWNCGFNIWNTGDKEFTYYPGTPDGVISASPCKIPLTEHPVFMRFDESRNKGEELLVYEKQGEEQEDHYRYMLSLPGVGDLLRSMMNAGFTLPTFQIDHVANFAYGNLIFITFEHFPEMHDVFKRFAKVFEQTYTRFLDLQKAEAQAKEAQIEAALERVRSRSMAMHKSDELLEAGEILFLEMQKLGIESLTAGYVLIDKEEKNGLNYTPHPGTKKIMPVPVIIPHNETIHMQQVVENWKKGDYFFIVEMDENETIKHQTFIAERSTNFPLSAAELIAISPAKLFLHNFYFKEGYILIVGGTKLSAEQTDIMLRFGKVFQQTYTRFLDLQKAEAQAREAQVEAALERVRSRSMAMHKSNELLEAGEILFLEMQKLGIESLTAGYVLIDKEEKNGWNYIPHPGTKKIMPVPVIIPHNETIQMQQVVENWKKGNPFFIIEMDEHETIKHQTFIAERSTNFPLTAAQHISISPARLFLHNFYFKEGYVLIVGGTKLSAEQTDIMLRFAKVFQQTYTRFLDLQKAEAQAREAKIEAALEKARSRSMGMQSSDELPEVANVLFTEVRALGIPAWSCGYNILAEDKTSATCWMSSEGTLQLPFKLRLFGEASFAEMGDFIRSEQTMLVQELGDKALEEHYAYMKSFPDLKPTFDQIDELGLSLPTYQINHLCKFTQGFLLFITYEKVPDSHDIFKRFTKVFEQTFTRFLDLQKAEAQAREAQIELALERIRSKVTAMQESSELLDIVVAMRSEFVALGHEAHYFWHMRWLPDKYEKAMTSGDGSRIGMVMQLPRHMHGDIKLLADWEKSYEPTVVFAMDAESAVDYVQKMVTLGDFEIVDPNAPTFEDIRHIGGLTFIMARTTHGEIGYSLPGCVADPPAEGIATVARFAGVFDLAYKRFEDLKTAEKDLLAIKAARLKAEDALAELQETQKQLIQSEKMASLGELTAGIAHEIQNPLNFVNNFSDVSTELIDEMNEELATGNQQYAIGNVQEAIVNLHNAMEIANDLKRNLEKINHHGKRAGDIVKGMLQHSRSSNGTKEPTDINKLADEYLRLAYHGLRAKDKSFNATLKTDFDESIGNINIIPQDVGRVILNLITNAFYVVNEKSKQKSAGYEPTVLVSTKKLNSKIEISIKDNGNGIPDSTKEKIFQPFFTTKPTGQGTGLGLSLSYDIIKAHGGELKVETKEGQESVFSIILPVT